MMPMAEMGQGVHTGFVQLTLAEGCTLEQKRGFYKQVVDEPKQRLKLRREDVFISLVGTVRDDCSFGNGDSSAGQVMTFLPVGSLRWHRLS
jgi:hypothetical protein